MEENGYRGKRTLPQVAYARQKLFCTLVKLVLLFIGDFLFLGNNDGAVLIARREHPRYTLRDVT